ncbi:PREDICTED: uncharacterized protein LOC108361526 [Rhagoletis zephyria]|uniref:uncharacterized protein LOC108361526 n=1 Tax=Rhagoletis zephyria TaxID=28612 RepID=UPI000811A4B8|nr:PREDICTED: uncharacterized protein LOC108361526 [Rhagoletis zephyria]
MAELNLRLAASNAIQKSAERIRLNGKIWDTCQLEQELAALRSYFTKFEVNHDKLVAIATKEEFALHEDLWDKVEGIYNEAVALVSRQLKEATSSPPASSVQVREQPQSQLKLDPLVVPSFDGQLHNWLAFRDLFESLIHKQQYPEAYNLAKLLQAIPVESVPLIGSHYSGGYEEVWKALNDRYNSRRHLAEAHVTRLLNMKPTTEDSQKALLSVVDQVRESLRALQVMELPVNSWDAIMVPIVVSKVPTTVQRHWNMSLTTPDIPNLEDLLKFLEKRAHSLACDGGANFSIATAGARQEKNLGPYKLILSEQKRGNALVAGASIASCAVLSC